MKEREREGQLIHVFIPKPSTFNFFILFITTLIITFLIQHVVWRLLLFITGKRERFV